MKTAFSSNKGLFVTLLLVLFLATGQGLAQPFGQGDVFAAVNGAGLVKVYSNAGVFIQTLSTGVSGFNTGMAFDASGNLYVTNFGVSSVSKLTGPGIPHTPSLFGSGYSTPECILFDATGNAYVGNLGNGIRKYTPAGVFTSSSFTGRVDWMDLAADQCTMLYATEGSIIFRHNVCTNTALTNFATGLTQAFALRIRSNGEVLVADLNNVKRYNSSGGLITTYDVASENTWFALNLDPDGTSFWSGNFGSANFYKIDIATGAVLVGPINTGTGANTLFGLAVFGESTVGACANNTPPEFVTPTPTCGSTIAATLGSPVSFVVKASDADASQSVQLNVSGLPAGSTMTPPLPTSGNPVQSTFSWTPAVSGLQVVTFSITDNCSTRTCSFTINVQGGQSDPTPPSCNITAIIPGPPKQIQVTVQDLQSGLASVQVLTSTNANTVVPAFTPGTTSPVVITATKINQNAAATIILRVTDVAGNSVVCDPVYTTISAEVPLTFGLGTNYPNPFNPTTRISFNVAKAEGATSVSLKIYDLLGREVKTLISEPMQPGEYFVDWDGTNDQGNAVVSGVYLYRMVAGDFVESRRMTLMK